MDYVAAFKFAFSHVGWGKSFLCCVLCFLIPIVGPIVALGYLCYVTAALIQSRHPTVMPALPSDATGALGYQATSNFGFPAFDFNRFGDYLSHGIWPFLVSLVTTIPLLIIIYGGIGLGILAGVTVRDGRVALAVILALMFCGFLFMLLFSLFVAPVFLRSKLTQSFSKAFNFAFILDFIRKVGFILLINQLVMFVLSLPLIAIAYLTCGLGMYPFMAYIMFVQTSVLAQTYIIYLNRGGEPILLDPSLLAAMPSFPVEANVVIPTPP